MKNNTNLNKLQVTANSSKDLEDENNNLEVNTSKNTLLQIEYHDCSLTEVLNALNEKLAAMASVVPVLKICDQR